MMKSLPEEINTGKTVLAAEMYYLYDMSQKEIADRLNVSRPWVSKLLKRARETGLVRIEINSPLVGSPEIEQRLREKYRIRNITVIRPLAENDYTNISLAAASWLAAHIQKKDTIGVSWGMSIADMIGHIVEMNFPEVNVVPIVGGAGSQQALLSNTNAANLAQTLGASCTLLHASACCSDEQEWKSIMSNTHVRELIDQGERADIALLGIGDLDHSRIIDWGYTTEEDLAQIRTCNAAGDVAFRFLQENGEIADIDFNRRVVACDLHKIRKNAREVIAIAYGPHKARILRAALKSGLITTLFTDSETAQALL